MVRPGVRAALPRCHPLRHSPDRSVHSRHAGAGGRGQGPAHACRRPNHRARFHVKHEVLSRRGRGCRCHARCRPCPLGVYRLRRSSRQSHLAAKSPRPAQPGHCASGPPARGSALPPRVPRYCRAASLRPNSVQGHGCSDRRPFRYPSVEGQTPGSRQPGAGNHPAEASRPAANPCRPRVRDGNLTRHRAGWHPSHRALEPGCRGRPPATDSEPVPAVDPCCQVAACRPPRKAADSWAFAACRANPALVVVTSPPALDRALRSQFEDRWSDPRSSLPYVPPHPLCAGGPRRPAPRPA
ncbi:hypothetical protein DFJ67_2318 [Asanoa ferruginea]|uniref:Uncharacterized protein n=1 Tax=Asanoa ferruginea TaxID=53367 RepID=A0A3D9ZGD9_9ACTN|nr:hypothetical protein DFJ67_2318 [Asanoa ferruginea]